MAIVYIHTGENNGEIFYVGIGKSIDRARSKHKRNKFWNNYVAIHGFVPTVLFDNLTWEEASLKEIELINTYGRRSLGEGTLVNITEGGQGGATMTGRKNPILSTLNISRKGIPGIRLKWINKDGKNSRTTEDKLDEYIKNGWSLGALKTGPRPETKGKPTWNKGITGYKNPKLSDSLRGRVYKKQEKVTCPYCTTSGIISNMNRWHFNNCKNKKNE
jgi:hypothetical protein